MMKSFVAPTAVRHPNAGEEARQQVAIGIVEQAAHQDRAGHGIEFRRDVVEEALVGEALFVHQADIERYLAEFLDGQALLELVADIEDVLLAHVEFDVDRVELDDGGELGRVAVADQFADRDQMLGDDAVERRHHGRVAQVGLGDDEVAFLVLDIGPRRIALGLAWSKVFCAVTFWRNSVSWRVNSAWAFKSWALAESSSAWASLTLAWYMVCSITKSMSPFFTKPPSV